MAQQLTEEAVVAEPLPSRVERGDEHSGPLQTVQHGGGVVSSGDRRTQRRCQLVQDRGVQQEGALVGGQPGEYLGAEVVQDEAVGAGEGVDEPAAMAGRIASDARPARRLRASPRCAG